jgi:hypothetical protein
MMMKMSGPTGWSKKRVLAHTLSSSDGYASTASGSGAAARDLGSARIRAVPGVEKTLAKKRSLNARVKSKIATYDGEKIFNNRADSCWVTHPRNHI